MKAKINILIIAIVLAIVVFGISTYLQKKLIHYEPMISCLILNKDINENEPVSKEDFKMGNVPISIIATQKVVTSFDAIEGLYAKDNIKSGQIAMRSQFDTKENLSVYEAEAGKEKLSIKIKTAENGMSFQIKPKAKINVYATLRNEYANGFALEKERLEIGNEYDGYTILKLLENIEVLGVFTADGIEMENADGENIDSILIAVTPEEAKQVNLMREIATFNVTGINPIKQTLTEETKTEENLMSGDEQIPIAGDEI